MCTVLVSLRPDADWPVLVLAVRDELLGRPWRPPARHWPDRTGLVGGLDEQAGGTWLALDPATGRLACVLNAAGRPTAAADRRSRGILPLLAAAGDPVPDDLDRYDPFHLLDLDATALRVTSWDGYQPHRYRLGSGDHLFVNQGRWLGPADRRSPRADHFGPLFAAAPRPRPVPGAPVEVAWAPWLALIDGPDVPPVDDPRALVVRAAGDGAGVWGTSSVTLLGVSATGELRYDFRAGPGPDHPWRPVDVG